MRTYIIAEACSNILPATSVRIDLYCAAAKEAGADAIKIQLFTASHFPSEEQEAKKESEFPRDMLGYFANTCRKLDLEWGASVFDIVAIHFLRFYKADFIKLATREQNNEKLISRAIRQKKIPVIRSVDWRPGSFGRGPVDGTITLGCFPEYPCTLIPGYLDRLPKPFGWSSHSFYMIDVSYAITYGAQVIEKHFCLEEDAPERQWSFNKEEFTQMVNMIRSTENELSGSECIDTEQSKETTTSRLECLLREAGRS